MNKVHFESEPSAEERKMYGANVRYAYCGDSTYCGDKLKFTVNIKKITCLACVRDLFKRGEVELVWKETA